jgi:hypothetical protein
LDGLVDGLVSMAWSMAWSMDWRMSAGFDLRPRPARPSVHWSLPAAEHERGSLSCLSI